MAQALACRIAGQMGGRKVETQRQHPEHQRAYHSNDQRHDLIDRVLRRVPTPCTALRMAGIPNGRCPPCGLGI